MSFTIPGEKESVKRRRVEDGTDESEKEKTRGRSSSASSRNSCGSLPGGAEMDVYKELVETAYGHWMEHNKETGDLFNSKEDFKEKITRTTAKDWGAACRSLVILAEKDAKTLWGLVTSEELCDTRTEKIEYMASLATDQYERYNWALREYAHRYKGTVKEHNILAKEKVEWLAKEEDWEERIKKLTVEKNEAEAERDRLLAALTTREEAGGRGGTTPPPPRNTGPELMELGEEVSSPSPGDVAIPKALLGALEKWMDKKWEQLASQLTPPSIRERGGDVPATKGPGTWAGAVGQKAERRGPPPVEATSPVLGRGRNPVRLPPAVISGARTRPTRVAPPRQTGKKEKEKRWPALPGSAVVAINPVPGGTQTGAGLIREAQTALSLEELGIPPLEIRRSKMGGYLLGIRGREAGALADRLADGLRGLPGATSVAVTRPVKRLDIRVHGLNAGTTPAEVVNSVAAAGDCATEEIKTGTIRYSPLGMGVLWLSCPVAAAIKVAKVGAIKVGWARAPVALLKSRPERCFRCLELGHLRVHCTSLTDRSGRCYRCGRTGHAANGCEEAVPRCPLCGDIEGHNSCHVLGGRGCMEAPPRRQPAAETAARGTPTGVT